MAELACRDGRRLHVGHWPGRGSSVLLLHGAVSNGRIFAGRNGRGLAPWLAANGFDAHVLDLRGRGRSTPPIGRGSEHGQLESIVADIPAAADHVAAVSGDAPQHWIAHSWGGVLMAATLARCPAYRARVASLTFFGAKRCVRVCNRHRLLYIDIIWLGLAPVLTRTLGYLPARRLGWGADNETRRSHAEGAAWVRPGSWVDPRDGFDYAGAMATATLPPLLALAGTGDPALGHPSDVGDFVAECGRGRKRIELLSRASGYQRDYGHIDMLTASEARGDIFPEVLDWLVRHDGTRCPGEPWRRSF